MQQDAPIFSKPAGQKDHRSPGRPRHPLGHAAGHTGQQKQGQCGEQQHPSKAAVRPAGKRIPFFAVSSRCLLFAVLAHAMRGQQ